MPGQTAPITQAPKQPDIRFGEEVPNEAGDLLLALDEGMYVIPDHPRRVCRIEGRTSIRKQEKVFKNIGQERRHDGLGAVRRFTSHRNTS